MPAFHISSQFDAGAIEVHSIDDPQDIWLTIRPDSASTFAQWFYFCLQGAAGVPIGLRFLNAGQCAYPQGWEGYRVACSYDHQHWFRLDTDYDGEVLRVAFTPEGNRVYLAYFEPYSHERHLDLLGTAARSEHVTPERLGSTLDGRDMTLLRITHAQSAIPLAQKKKIWLIARQHPGETMAEWFVEGFLERLLDGADPVAHVLLDQCIFYVVPNMNPDGAVRGNLRTNAAGANLNREWAAPSAERSPEVACVRQKMLDVGVDLCLDAHGDESLPYNFVVGTEGTPGYNAQRAALEAAFKTHWLAASPDFQTEHGYERPAPGEANLTLATNWIGQQFDCLAFTIEMPFKDNANLPDLQTGWNGKRSMHLGASVLQPLLAVLGQLRA